MAARPLTLLATAAATMLVTVAGGPAKAVNLPAAPVSDAELDDMRGGYMSADGIQFGFGALLTTSVNGQLAMQTQVTWTSTGEQILRTVNTGNVAQGAAGVTNGVINGLNTAGFAPGSVTVNAAGTTAVIQNVSGATVQNIVLNTASGQNISLNTQVQLTVPNLTQFQQLVQQNVALVRLMQSTGQSALLGH